MSRRKIWQWHTIEIVMALFLVLLIAGEVSAYIYSPLQSTSFGSNTVINEKDTTIGVFYHNKVLDFSKSVFDGLNSQNKQNDGINNAPEPKKDKQNDGINNAPKPKKDKQNDGINNALEPKKDKQNDEINNALEPKKDKKNDDTIYIISNGSISGYKINDTNNNGIWDVGENAIEGGEIRLIGLAGINIKNETMTDKNGFYAFTGLPEGGYIVKEEKQMGWKHTNSTVKKIELEIGENSINNNFTNIRKKSYCETGIISGYKINDTNSNGEWNKGEENLSGWTITLIRKYENDEEISEETNFYEFTNIPGADGCEIGKKKIPKWTFDLMKRGGKHIKYETVTDENGYYEFSYLQKGEYIVKEEMQNGWINTTPIDRLVTINGRDVFNVNFTNRNITTTPPQPPVTTFAISGYKINGTYNVNISLPGWKISLKNITNGQEIKNTTTNSLGFYSFTGLSNGTYNVTEEMETGWVNISEAYRHIVIYGVEVPDVNFTNNNLSANPPQSATVSIAGSDGCGRNVNTNEKYSNVKQHEYSKEIDVYISKSTIALSFKTLGILTEAGFTPKTNKGCITALGEILKGRPSQAESEVPYQDATYFNVWVGPWGYSESSKVENQYLVFKKADVKDNEIVKLMMYRDGAWNEVRTEKLSEGTYKAYTQGFGSFAIVKTQAPTMTTQPAVTDVPGENKGMEPVNLALIIGVFLVILIGVIYYLKIR